MLTEISVAALVSVPLALLPELLAPTTTTLAGLSCCRIIASFMLVNFSSLLLLLFDVLLEEFDDDGSTPVVDDVDASPCSLLEPVDVVGDD